MAISTITWPAELPQQMLIEGYNESPNKQKIRTEMDAAIAKQRPRFSTTTGPFTGGMVMTDDQYNLFKEFFSITLGNGCLEFNMPKPGNTIETHVVRFTLEDYQPTKRGLYWVVVLNLETLP